MRKRNSKKERLFRLYSTNLSKNTNLEEGWFLCPLCHKGFTWEMRGLLTIEHVVPKSLGGRIETLTCKECNNQQGEDLLSKLKQNILMEDKFQNQKPFDAKMTVNGKEISVGYRIGEKHELITQAKRSNPRDVAFIEDVFKSGLLPEIGLKFSYGYKKEIEQMAILLICYLMLFRFFGYSYAFSPWGIYTRNVIVSKKYDSPLLKMTATTNEVVMDGKNALFICRQPKEFENYAGIQLRLKVEGFEKTLTKLLPFLPGTYFNKEVHLKGGELEIRGNSISYSPALLTDPAFKVPHNIRV